MVIRKLKVKKLSLRSHHFKCLINTEINFLFLEGRRLADRFREHLSDVERNDPNHSKQHMAVSGLSLHLEVRKAAKL